jgi:hypothetical protein
MVDVTIQSTKVTEKAPGFSVEMILASGVDLEVAPEVVQLRVSVDINEQCPRLARLQQAALAHVQDVIEHEIKRLGSLLHPLPA